MKKLVSLLLISGCILASNSDKDKNKDNDKGKDKGNDWGRNAVCGYWGGSSKEVTDYCRNGGNGGGNSSKSGNSKNESGHGHTNNRERRN